jgi:peptide/nickel transport system substrate-binding protein
MSADAMRRLHTRRSALRAFGIGGALLLGACNAPATGPTSGVLGAAGAGQPKPGGTLRVGLVGDLVTLDGHFENTNAGDTLFHIWDRLTEYDDKLQPQPMLATSWEQSPDARQLTLHLRQGVHFHTGRELTSEDVKFNLLRVKDPKVGPLNGNASPLSGVDTPDKYTVIVHSDDPWPWVFDLLEFLNIIDPVTFESEGLGHPVGTGPFVFAEHAQGDHLRLVKNRAYWQSGLPYVDEYTISFLQDPTAMVTQLEAGALDIVDNPLPQDARRLERDNNYRLLQNPHTGRGLVFLANATFPPLNNKLVRQALTYALDRKRIVDSALYGFGEPNQLPWGPTSAGYDAAKNTTYTFDLDKARSLLETAGATGFAIDIEYNSASNPLIGQIYQADLAKIGVSATLKPVQAAAFAQDLVSTKYRGMVLVTILQSQLQMGTQVFGPYYTPATNWTGFRDDQYTALASQVATETDPTRQKSTYAQFNDYVLDQSFVLPLCSSAPVVVSTARVNGLTYSLHESVMATRAWLT